MLWRVVLISHGFRLQMAPAGPGTLMRMNDVVFAFLFGIFILHEYPDAFTASLVQQSLS